jgi:cyclophilin family peptidyl-prolyl cis-trans isomerase
MKVSLKEGFPLSRTLDSNARRNSRTAPGHPALRAVLLAGAAAVLCAVSNAPAPAADSPATLMAILEVDREAYYAGDPIPVRISIWNNGAAPVDAPGGAVEAGFLLFDSDGKKIEAAPNTAAGQDAKGPAEARKLGPGLFFGYSGDVTAIYPRLKQPGSYRLQWASGGLAANIILLKVVPRYDPDKDYTATIDTDLGSFTIDLYRKDAPLAVKTFVELSLTKYYDGTVFHFVEPDRIVSAGDPTGTGLGGPGFSIPPEITKTEMVAGTVFMLPKGHPPANGSLFHILLAPRKDFEGKVTAFGQVTEGMDVVGKISRASASPRGAAIPHRPLKDVHIKSITVKPKTA